MEEKEKAKAALQKVDSVSLTADVWILVNVDVCLVVMSCCSCRGTLDQPLGSSAFSQHSHCREHRQYGSRDFEIME